MIVILNLHHRNITQIDATYQIRMSQNVISDTCMTLDGNPNNIMSRRDG